METPRSFSHNRVNSLQADYDLLQMEAFVEEIIYVL